MANEVNNSKELNEMIELDEMKLKIKEAELQTEFRLTTLKSLACLFNDVKILQNNVTILRMKMKYITFSIISMAVSSIFLSLLYWL